VSALPHITQRPARIAHLRDVAALAETTTEDRPRAAAAWLEVLSLAPDDVGALLAGSLEAVLEKEAYKRFYMHRTGHWLGMDVHDVGEYKRAGQWRALAAGMTLTVEPGLYIRAADDVPEPLRDIGVRLAIQRSIPMPSSAGRTISVTMKPGDTEFTRTPRSAHSQPSCRVRLRSAPFAAVYASVPAPPP